MGDDESERTFEPAADPTQRLGEVDGAAVVRLVSSSSRCATTSVSVSDTSSCPRSSSSRRSRAKFSMMPLWMTATEPVQSTCGCALRSVGAPWVAHRVCPMPVVAAGIGCSASAASRLASLPARFSVSSLPSAIRATPAES